MKIAVLMPAPGGAFDKMLDALSRLDATNEYVLYTEAPPAWSVGKRNFRGKPLGSAGFWSRLTAPFGFLFGKYDLLVVTPGRKPPLFCPRTVAVVEDVQAGFPALPRTDRVLAVSERPRADVARTLGMPEDRIEVTPPGYDDTVFRLCHDGHKVRQVGARYGLDGAYFISAAGSLLDRVLQLRHLEAFAGVRAGYSRRPVKLLVVGKRGEPLQEARALVGRLGVQDSVVLTDELPPEDLCILMGAAEGLIFASQDEASGPALVRAMACGCPVIVPMVPVLTGVAGDAALPADPKDPGALARAMATLLNEPQTQREMRRKGFARAGEFSWDRAARKALEVFEKTAKG